MNEPVPRFGMNLHFSERFVRDGFEINAQREAAAGGKLLAIPDLVAGQIPMGVKPVRVAGSEQQSFCTVGFWKLPQLAGGSGMLARRRGAERIAFSWPADLRRRRFIAFERNRRHLDC